jgi:hypothetical protein
MSLNVINKLLLFGFAGVLVTGATGCIVTPEPVDQGPPPTHYTPPPADQPVVLGAQAALGYHVLAGAASELPAGDIGFVITANGQGGYRLTWSDTLGSTAEFAGTITCDSTFDPTQLKGYSGYETITLSSDNRTITFDSVPGSALDGVDLVSGSDPIYVDMTVNGIHSGFSIYFTGAQSSLLLTSQYDPVAFTSP